MSVPLAYRGLLITYPPAWRQKYEQVVVATLMEEDTARGRRHPSLADRMHFFTAGLSRRTRRAMKPVLPPLIAPDHRFDQTNGLIVEREPTVFELVHARWWDQQPPPTFIPVGMVGRRPNSLAR